MHVCNEALEPEPALLRRSSRLDATLKKILSSDSQQAPWKDIGFLILATALKSLEDLRTVRHNFE